MNEPDKGTVPAVRSTSPLSSDSATPVSAGDQVTQKRSEPSALPRDLTAPDVPGYELSRKLGEGGMGTVYLAHDPTFERAVAVKVMHTGQDAARFVTESKVTAQLPHPGVPPVYALGEAADGRPFLAMKLVEGRTLSDELRSVADSAELPRLLGAFERICETVGFAHSRGIVHRDLKPQNVMIGAHGEVLVMDWGIAKSVGESQPAGEGTPAYMAPEQARGGTVDPRADVYALGGILTAVLTGRPSAVGLDTCPADAELVATARRCLSSDAAERYADGTAVAAAVASYRAGVEERLRKAERERAAAEAKAVEQRKKRRVQMALAVAVLALFAGIGSGAWYYQWQHEQQRQKSEQARVSVRAGLETAAAQRKAFRFGDARATLSQAADSARRDAPELMPGVEQAQSDLEFVVKLDDIRYRKLVPATETNAGPHRFKTENTPPAYRQAFAGYGLDLTALAAADAAKRIADSVVKAELVAAVDDWALYEPDPRLRDELLAVARGADPGPWTDKLRDPAVRADKAAVERLAAELPAAVAPSALGALAELMHRAGLDPAPLMTRARRTHPTDFELAFVLGARLAGERAVARTMLGENNDRNLEIGPLEAARALRPDNPYVWINLGHSLGYSDDYDGAAAAYAEAVRIDPKCAAAHVAVGTERSRRGDNPGAIAAFREAVRVEPHNASAHNMLAMYLLMSYPDEALAEAREALRIEPNNAHYHSSHGLLLGFRGDRDGEVTAFREAVRLDPKTGAFQISLGRALWTKGDTAGAKAVLADIARLELRPFEYTALGMLLEFTSDRAGAERAYRESIRLTPKVSMPYVTLGSVLMARKDWAGAADVYREAIRNIPKEVTLYSSLAMTLRLKGDAEGARAVVREAVRANPGRASAHQLLGDALRTDGDLRGAMAAYAEALRIGPNLPVEWMSLGFSLKAAGDARGAVTAYKEAVRRDPRDGMPRAYLGGALLEIGETAAAVAEYQEAVRINPKSVSAQVGLGDALKAKGDPTGAAAAYREAIRHDPTGAGAYAKLAEVLRAVGDVSGAEAARADAARLSKNRPFPLPFPLPTVSPSGPPPRPVAPPPRPVKP